MPDRSTCAKATFVFNEALIQDKIELFSLVLWGGWGGAGRGESVYGQGPPGSLATQNLRASGQATLRVGLAASL